MSDCNLAELKAVIEWKDAVMKETPQSRFSNGVRLVPTGKELAAQVSKVELSTKDDELFGRTLYELQAIIWGSPNFTNAGINTSMSVLAPALVAFKQDAAT